MRHLSALLFLLFFTYTTISAQQLGTWEIYKSYYSTDLVEETTDKVYVVARGSLYSYNKEDTSIKEYYKYYDLNDNNISLIGYNKTTKSLLIIYKNSNIDILEGSTVYNLPYLYEHTLFANKNVNSIYLHNQYAYISTGFGIMVIDMETKLSLETYNLNTEVTSCTIYENHIYATTQEGIKYAPLSVNLLDKNNWSLYTGYPLSLTDNKYLKRIFTFKDNLYFFVAGSGIYDMTGKKFHNDPYATDIKVTDPLLYAKTYNGYFIYSNLTNGVYNKFTDDETEIKDISSYNDPNNLWIAYGDKGLMEISKNSSSQFTIAKDAITLNGPYINSPYRMVYDNSRLYMIGGGESFTSNYLENIACFMLYQDGVWTSVTNKPIKDKYGIEPRDYLSIAIDPNDPDNIYASTLGYGLVQIKNMEIENLYNSENSPLEIAGNDPIRKERINGVTFDKDNNLWMLNYVATDGIKILDKDGKWHSKYITSISKINYLSNLLITSKNQRWIAVPQPQSNAKVVVIDNVDIASISDNTSVTYTAFVDQDGELFSPSGYTCLAEDKKGYIWVGTQEGPVYFVNPDNAFANPSNFRCTRIKHTNDDGIPYYFLDNVQITTIAIDGGNRKWIGTASSGVYVLSDDNEEVVYHFDTSNSPLLSNGIYSITFDHNSGNVFIGTDEGLVSYLSEAVAPEDDFSNVYSFPNPVNPDYNGLVTITGLMDNTNIKITDLNGNLIYQTKSIGGQATWNCRNRSGGKVATGVYLVFGATENGSESVVTKIVVIK